MRPTEGDGQVGVTVPIGIPEPAKTEFIRVWTSRLGQNVPVGLDWLAEFRSYERDVLAKRS